MSSQVCDGFPIDNALVSAPLGMRSLFESMRAQLADQPAPIGVPALGAAADGKESKEKDAAAAAKKAGTLQTLRDERLLADLIARLCVVRPTLSKRAAAPAAAAAAAPKQESKADAKKGKSKADKKEASAAAAAPVEAAAADFPTPDSAVFACGSEGQLTVPGAARVQATEALFGDNVEGISLVETIMASLEKVTRLLQSLTRNAFVWLCAAVHAGSARVRRSERGELLSQLPHCQLSACLPVLQVLCGGTASLPGLSQRLTAEIKAAFGLPRYADFASERAQSQQKTVGLIHLVCRQSSRRKCG